MRIAIESFRGEAPRVTPRELPENAAQAAVNARLQSGDLESWRQFAFTHTLVHSADVETIYLLNDVWLSWEADVDVARGATPGDNTFRTYLTGPDVYDQPRFTNYAMATAGAEPYPVVTRPLGVPAPDSQPSLASGVSTAPSSTTIEVIDSGDQLTESWTTNAPVSTAFTRAIVTEDAGHGTPGYLLTFAENVGQPAFMYRDFGVGDSQVVFFSCDVLFGPASRRRMFIDLLSSASGAGIGIVWTEGGNFQIGIMGGFSATGFSALSGESPGGPGPGIWYTVTGQIVRNAAGTKTVTATLYVGSVQLATVTVTNAFVNDGGNFGFVGEVSEPTSPDLQTYYDNIVVRGTSPTATLQQTATSYVYTFVNDLGEESAPSPPSATVLKDDGTAITVTTATVVPSGFSVDYGVTTKRIYRSVSGATGTVFEFVAEIPLSQADYVDELTDAELGDPLESELYALPPDDLRGILALPNGIMVGFRRNQICFSVQNRPHAWPVEWRLNTDTDVVGIGNIDTTLVIGTEAFPYLAIGNDPSAYSMTKLEKKQACVAKRSVAYLTSIGVVFASPDGIIAVSGNGSVRNLTETIFTRRQWQALVPETITAIEHDDVYYFFAGESPTFDAVQVFESNGVWTRPEEGITQVSVAALAAGGGGGGGALSGASFSPTGGGAGGGGSRVVGVFDPDDLGATVTITVGVGGAGGLGRPDALPAGSGSDGGIGGNTTFGTHLTAYGGGGGQGGHNNAVIGGGGGGGGDSAAGTTGTPAGNRGLGGATNGGDGGDNTHVPESVVTSDGAGGAEGSNHPLDAGGSSVGGGSGGGGGGGSTSALNSAATSGTAGGTSELVTTPAAGGLPNLPGSDGEDPSDLTQGKAGGGGGGGGGSGFLTIVGGFDRGLAGNGGQGGKGSGGGGGGGVYASLGVTGNGGDGGDGLLVVTMTGEMAEAVPRIGHALDMKETGFGLITLGFHALAVHSDPLTDNLYLVLSEDEEPTGPSGTLLGSTAPLLQAPFVTIYQFDADEDVTAMTYRFKGKLNLLPRPTTFEFCQVKADDYDNLVMNLYADGVLFFTSQIVSKEPFKLLMEDEYEKLEFEFVGTSRVQTAQFVEDIRELT